MRLMLKTPEGREYLVLENVQQWDFTTGTEADLLQAAVKAGLKRAYAEAADAPGICPGCQKPLADGDRVTVLSLHPDRDLRSRVWHRSCAQEEHERTNATATGALDLPLS